VADHYHKLTSRNIGLLTDEEQDTLRNASIGIAGVGGIGGLLAERLVRLGVENLKISDPGEFETSNLNRQFASATSTMGQNKARAIRRALVDINPNAKIQIDSDGIKDFEDAQRFAHGCEIVIDEMDFGLFNQAAHLQRAARENGAFYMFSSAIGFGALIVIFDPNGCTLEQYNRQIETGDPRVEKQPELSTEQIVPVMPRYLADKKSMVDQMIAGEIPVSTLSIGVGLASVVTALEAANLLLKHEPITFAPDYLHIDLREKIIHTGNKHPNSSPPKQDGPDILTFNI
jgi:molybdopterin/thiamine biosynthesis adenylyltransferase